MDAIPEKIRVLCVARSPVIMAHRTMKGNREGITVCKQIWIPCRIPSDAVLLSRMMMAMPIRSVIERIIFFIRHTSVRIRDSLCPSSDDHPDYGIGLEKRRDRHGTKGLGG
jgi:hypothetical protein